MVGNIHTSRLSPHALCRLLADPDDGAVFPPETTNATIMHECGYAKMLRQRVQTEEAPIMNANSRSVVATQFHGLEFKRAISLVNRLMSGYSCLIPDTCISHRYPE